MQTTYSKSFLFLSAHHGINQKMLVELTITMRMHFLLGVCGDNEDVEFQQNEFNSSTRTTNIDSGLISAYYVEYIIVSN